MHAGVKKCTTCSKCYVSSRNLARHMIMHTGEKNYKLEVGEGGTSRRRAVGRSTALPPTEGRAKVRRSKVEGRRSKVEGRSRSQRVEVRGSKSEGQSQRVKVSRSKSVGPSQRVEVK